MEELFETDDLNDRKGAVSHGLLAQSWRGEMFFAKKTIFVEGETEKSIFLSLAQKLGCYNSDISIVDCGSKHNLPLYIAIANAFSLSYHVLHDEDPLPDPIPEEWNDDKQREKRRTFELNQEISNLTGLKV